MRSTRSMLLSLCFTALLACQCHSGRPAAEAVSPNFSAPSPGEPTAEAFLQKLSAEYLARYTNAERADFVYSTHLTDDTAVLVAQAKEALMRLLSARAAEAERFSGEKLEAPLERKRKLVKLLLNAPAPRDPQKLTELATLLAQLDTMYGTAKVCSPEQKDKSCRNLDELEIVLKKSRSYDELLEAWKGWHDQFRSMRPLYQRYASLANEGARDLGFTSLSELWNGRFDMPAADFEAETERLWQQLKPLYVDLHCYVREKLGQKHGRSKVPQDGPIPAHLLGNMWAQEWGNLIDLLAPERGSTLDLDAAIARKKLTELDLVRTAERFFVSLGFEPLPQTFWKRSLFLRPRDREVICHASAWDIDMDQDVRLKMCIQRTAQDLSTIHHELGHIYYYLNYRTLDPLFRNAANEGFHEAMGDLIGLSVTPSYLKEIGLLEKLPKESLNELMFSALNKVAFLPFALMIDRWRWGVFRGTIAPERYNQAWWELRKTYQGVAPAGPRTEDDFDPGAKYHVPANVPYTRYFLATVLQYQFHRALCRLANHRGPLSTCSLYGNREIGERLRQMMRLGASQPWPQALKELTGEERMDATAVLDYFQPLHDWLKQQNQGKTCGW